MNHCTDVFKSPEGIINKLKTNSWLTLTGEGSSKTCGNSILFADSIYACTFTFSIEKMMVVENYLTLQDT